MNQIKHFVMLISMTFCREVLVLVAGMESPAPLETPETQDLQDLPALLGLVE